MFSWFGRISFVPYSKIQEFTVHLKEGRLMGSVCKGCGFKSFPPRSDCPACLSSEYGFEELSGRGRLQTMTTIAAAPSGFEGVGRYTIGLVDLDEGGRLLAWIGDSIPPEERRIDMAVQVVPRLFEESEDIKVHYTIERAGTTWSKAPAFTDRR